VSKLTNVQGQRDTERQAPSENPESLPYNVEAAASHSAHDGIIMSDLERPVSNANCYETNTRAMNVPPLDDDQLVRM